MRVFFAHLQQQVLDLLPAILLLFFGLAALAYAMLQPTGAKGQFGVILKPWANPSQVILLLENANAQILNFDSYTNIAVVYSDRKDAVADLYEAGAWFVFEPNQLSTCVDFNLSGI